MNNLARALLKVDVLDALCRDDRHAASDVAQFFMPRFKDENSVILRSACPQAVETAA